MLTSPPQDHGFEPEDPDMSVMSRKGWLMGRVQHACLRDCVTNHSPGLTSPRRSTDANPRTPVCPKKSRESRAALRAARSRLRDCITNPSPRLTFPRRITDSNPVDLGIVLKLQPKGTPAHRWMELTSFPTPLPSLLSPPPYPPSPPFLF